MNYRVIRTDMADAQIRSILLFIAEKFGADVALENQDIMLPENRFQK